MRKAKEPVIMRRVAGQQSVMPEEVVEEQVREVQPRTVTRRTPVKSSLYKFVMEEPHQTARQEQHKEADMVEAKVYAAGPQRTEKRIIVKEPSNKAAKNIEGAQRRKRSVLGQEAEQPVIMHKAAEQQSELSGEAVEVAENMQEVQPQIIRRMTPLKTPFDKTVHLHHTTRKMDSEGKLATTSSEKSSNAKPGKAKERAVVQEKTEAAVKRHDMQHEVAAREEKIGQQQECGHGKKDVQAVALEPEPVQPVVEEGLHTANEALKTPPVFRDTALELEPEWAALVRTTEIHTAKEPVKTPTVVQDVALELEPVMSEFHTAREPVKTPTTVEDVALVSEPAQSEFHTAKESVKTPTVVEDVAQELEPAQSELYTARESVKTPTVVEDVALLSKPAQLEFHTAKEPAKMPRKKMLQDVALLSKPAQLEFHTAKEPAKMPTVAKEVAIDLQPAQSGLRTAKESLKTPTTVEETHIVETRVVEKVAEEDLNKAEKNAAITEDSKVKKNAEKMVDAAEKSTQTSGKERAVVQTAKTVDEAVRSATTPAARSRPSPGRRRSIMVGVTT
ncbi:hypothetical protein OESDEN_05398 [Oesophagostomum dentatum]|uniref:Uncharacterized protein n=1 Tax=Oesophagostomum dentatum TaxID=61180 RepID=A0A0B1TBP6_OESDE|nr:hypothetical protein OESDEN_05398 [Oesophagostomum dentatum]